MAIAGRQGRADMAVADHLTGRLTLTAGDLAVTVSPAIGGAIVAFTAGDTPILRPTPPAAIRDRRAGLCGSYAMIPYSNRIADAVFAFRGDRFQLARNFGAAP